MAETLADIELRQTATGTYVVARGRNAEGQIVKVNLGWYETRDEAKRTLYALRDVLPVDV